MADLPANSVIGALSLFQTFTDAEWVALNITVLERTIADTGISLGCANRVKYGAAPHDGIFYIHNLAKVISTDVDIVTKPPE